jgi:hypothetical protein
MWFLEQRIGGADRGHGQSNSTTQAGAATPALRSSMVVAVVGIAASALVLLLPQQHCRWGGGCAVSFRRAVASAVMKTTLCVGPTSCEALSSCKGNAPVRTSGRASRVGHLNWRHIRRGPLPPYPYPHHHTDALHHSFFSPSIFCYFNIHPRGRKERLLPGAPATTTSTTTALGSRRSWWR